MYLLANWLKQLINYQIGRRIVSPQLMVELTRCGSSGLCAAPVCRKFLEGDLKKKKRGCKWRKDGTCSLYFNELLDFVKEQRWVTAKRLPFLHLSAEGPALSNLKTNKQTKKKPGYRCYALEEKVLFTADIGSQRAVLLVLFAYSKGKRPLAELGWREP